MILLYIFGGIGLIFLLAVFPYLRCFVLHPLSDLRFGIPDMYGYLRYRKWNDAEKTVGEISCFEGLFGEGKTLSEVHHVRALYNKYNNKMVFKNGKWKQQKIYILSNVDLTSTPFIRFSDMQQLVKLCEDIKTYDESNDTYSIIYVIIDEMQNVLNSRNFKSNFQSGSDVMRVLTQMRKFRASIFYTSTRFCQTDAFIRQDTMYVYRVHKIWRLQGYSKFDAFEYETCTNYQLLKPLVRGAWFVKDSDFNAYDTHALATQICNDVQSGNMISENERVNQLLEVNEVVPIHPSKKYKKMAKAR